MDKQNNKLFQQSVFASVVASLGFIYLLQPVIHLLWKFINTSTNKFVKNYSDSIYLNAALGKRNWLDFVIYNYFQILTFCLFFITLTIIVFKWIKAARNKKRNKINAIEDEKERETELKKFKENVNKKNNLFITIIDGKYSRIFIFLTAIYGIFELFKGTGRAYADLQLNASFHQRLDAIRPYIDNEEEDMLKSKWALMKERKDYVQINKELEKMSIKAKIELPKALYE